jgi:hypothetical protein
VIVGPVVADMAAAAAAVAGRGEKLPSLATFMHFVDIRVGGDGYSISDHIT